LVIGGIYGIRSLTILHFYSYSHGGFIPRLPAPLLLATSSFSINSVLAPIDFFFGYLTLLSLAYSLLPLLLCIDTDRIRFHPYFTTKDLIGFIFMALYLNEISGSQCPINGLLLFGITYLIEDHLC